MAAGWQSMVRIYRAPGWTDPGTTATANAVFLMADSVNFDYGAQEITRDGKIVGVRSSPQIQYYSAGQKIYPTGEFTYQPDSVSAAMLFLSLFQFGANTGGTNPGTYTFSPLNGGLNWGSGYAIGTYPYLLNVDVILDRTFGTNNGIRYMQGIVDKLTINIKSNADITITPSFKFKTASYVYFDSSYIPNSSQGSLYGETYTDVGVTPLITVGGVNLVQFLSISDITITLENNVADVAVIGGSNYAKYPFLSRFKAYADITSEWQVNPELIRPGVTTATFGATMTSVESINRFMRLFSNNNVIKPYSINVSSGDSIIEFTLPIELMNISATCYTGGNVTAVVGL